MIRFLSSFILNHFQFFIPLTKNHGKFFGYRVSQQVLAGSTGQNNHNGSWWVGWVYPRVVYHSKTFYFCGPLGRKYFQKKINLVSVETDFNFLYCDPSAQPIDTINGGMGWGTKVEHTTIPWVGIQNQPWPLFLKTFF